MNKKTKIFILLWSSFVMKVEAILDTWLIVCE